MTDLDALPSARLHTDRLVMQSDIDLDAINLAVRRLVAESLRKPVEEVPPDAFLDDLGLDSLALITLNVALEEHYDVSLPDFFAEEARPVRSLSAVAKLIAGRLAAPTQQGEPA